MNWNKFKHNLGQCCWFLIGAHLFAVLGFYVGPFVRIYWPYYIWFNISITFFYLLELQ